MIVFLTLCYCGLLALLVKLGVLKLTLWWKLSPAVWMLLLFVLLFIPMQWGAPTGSLTVYSYIIEIIPNVTGEIIEVPIEGGQALQKGDVLFKIDPTPYAASVDQAKAALEDAKQTVQQLEANSVAAAATVAKTEAEVGVVKSEQRSAQAAVVAAKAMLSETKGGKEKAIARVADLQTQVAAAQREYDRLRMLVDTNAVSQSEVDIAEVQVTGLKAQLNTAEVELRITDDTIARAEADVSAAKASAQVVDLQLKQLVETELPRVRAKAKEAELAASARIGDQHTMVARAQAQLEKAEFDLEQTTVKAPSDGYVFGLGLRPGQRVASFPVRTWMSFVPTEDTRLAVGIPQYALRHVRKGQPVEVTFKLFPGKVFPAVVHDVPTTAAPGQLHPSGTLVDAPATDQTPENFTVRLSLPADAGIDLASLPGGAVGTAAIYTDQVKGTHIIRRVMIRMQAWMNYLLPS